MVRALLLATVATLIVAGCSLHSIGPGVSNSSGQDFYVRVHYDYGEIHVLRAPAHKDVDVVWFGEVGELQASIELLRPDCSVVGSWRNASGGLITIDAAGSASFGPASEQEAANLLNTDEVGACGATQVPPASSGPNRLSGRWLTLAGRKNGFDLVGSRSGVSPTLYECHEKAMRGASPVTTLACQGNQHREAPRHVVRRIGPVAPEA